MTGLEIKITGSADLHALVLRLQAAERTDLRQQLHRGLHQAADDVADAITAHSDLYMPRGYEQIFKSSLYYKTEVRTAHETRITLIVAARSARGGDRAVRQAEAGEIRKPVFGRWRERRGVNRGRHKIKNKWAPQRIRARFATEPAENAAPQMWQRIDAAAARVVDKIEGA